MQLGLKTNISTSEGRSVRMIGVNEKDSKSEDGFFFNSKRFVQSRKLPGENSWFELIDNTGKVAGSIFLSIDKKQAWSHLNAPFGSLEKNSKLTQNDCDFMISGLLRSLKERGVETLEVTHYPHFYDSKTSEFVDHSYQSQGFNVIALNVNQHLHIASGDSHLNRPRS